MSFAELHQKELDGVNSSLFGEEGIVDRLRELRDLVILLGQELHKLGTKEETTQMRDSIRTRRLKASKLCDRIEKELQQLQSSKRSLSSSTLETTDEVERRQELSKIVLEFHKIKGTFNQLYFRPLEVTSSITSSKESFTESQLSLSQLKEIHIDFEAEHKELLKELQELLELFEEFKDIVSEQSLLLEEAEINTKGSLQEINIGKDELVQASKYGAFALPILGGGLGAVLGGPIGAAIGVKAGILLSGATFGVGAGVMTGLGVGYYYKKKKDQQESEWEWIPKK